MLVRTSGSLPLPLAGAPDPLPFSFFSPLGLLYDCQSRPPAAARSRSFPLLVLPAHRTLVRLPEPAVAVDPDPSLRTVEEIADALGALVVRMAAARRDLEDRSVSILDQRRVNVRRLLRRGLAEVSADGADLDGMLLLVEPPSRDVEL